MAIKIYIDQGHNPRSHNTGAEGNGYAEADVTFDVGKRLFALLSARAEFVCRLSRPSEDTVLGINNSDSLRVRVNDANAWRADLFLSIHTNAAENPAATGTEALIYGPSAKVARAVAENILYEMRLSTGLRTRGIIDRPGLYVLKKTRMPAVLVELGFLSNPYDAALMTNDPQLFARGIYKGLLRYYGLS